MKAKSRLKSASPHTSVLHQVETSSLAADVPSQPTHHRRNLSSGQKEVATKYFQHLKTFILCLPFYAICFYILKNVHPSNLKNALIPNLYFPFQLSLFLANLFFFSFLFLNTRRGFLISVFVQIFVFLKLQSVIMTWQLTIGVVVFFVIIETLLVLVSKKHHAKR